MAVQEIGPAGIPSLGLGTFQMQGNTVRRIVSAALAEGYRHIDTARAYENEVEVGQGLRDADVPRDQVFLTTKIFPDQFRAEAFRAASERSLRDLGTDYVDLLLLHWPSTDVPLAETLPVLDALIAEGKARYGGVSNFTIAQVRESSGILDTPIAANQIEFHPFIDQSKLLDFLEGEGIPFEAYSPLAQGRITEEPLLAEIARDHGVSVAEVTLAWILSKPNAVVIPKTATAERLSTNLRAADLVLGAEEIWRIDGLAGPNGRIVSPDGLAPEWD